MSDAINEGSKLIGRVVTSKAGRDKGRSFLVVAICDGLHVYVADGTLRKLVKPKKKKLKHLTIEQEFADMIGEKLELGQQVFDAQIRNCLIQFGYNKRVEEEKLV